MLNERRTDPILASATGGMLLLAAVGLLAGCAAEPPVPAEMPDAGDPIADRAEVVAAHEGLLAAMEAGDGEAVAALVDDRHDVLVFHPVKVTRFDGPDEIAAGIAAMMGRLAPVDVTDVHLQVWTEGDAAWLTSHLLIESDALDEPLAARGTEIWRRNDGVWKLAHAHWSSHPNP